MALFINGVEILGGSTASVTLGALTVTNDGTKTTLSTLSGDYFRIGDAATTGYSLNSEDDLMVTGELEVTSNAYFTQNVKMANDSKELAFGIAGDAEIGYQIGDTNARVLVFTIDESLDSGDNVPAFVFMERTNALADLGFLDEVVQPHLVVMENSGKYVNITNASSGGASTTLTTATSNTFDNSVVGDIVRVVSGTNATPGWYFIDAATDGTNIVTDRNWCTGAVTADGVVQAWHKVAMITPKAIYLPIYDAAPADSDIDIDMDGAMALEVTQANGRLYWRANNGWHYVDATAGLSMPKEERIDPDGNKFELGDKVELVIDRINEDGSFHAMPYRN